MTKKGQLPVCGMCLYVSPYGKKIYNINFVILIPPLTCTTKGSEQAKNGYIISLSSLLAVLLLILDFLPRNKF